LPWLFWRWGLLNDLPGWSSALFLPFSVFQVARITGVSHQCLALFFFFWWC
jgi:hypothetical protein